MIDLTAIVSEWDLAYLGTDEPVRKAPEGLTWIKAGSVITVGSNCWIDSFPRSIGNDCWFGEDVRIEYGAIIRDNVFLAKGAVVGANSYIEENTTIGEFCTIGSRCNIGSSVVTGRHVNIGYDSSVGKYSRVGDGSCLPPRTSIGSDLKIREGASEVIDLGHTDGCRKCICNVKGVAYISAGCRWFTVDAAIAHWAGDEERKLTMAIMDAAVAICKVKGWKQS